MIDTNFLQRGNLLLLNDAFFPNLHKKSVKATGIYDNDFVGFTSIDGSIESVVKCNSLLPLSITPENLLLFDGFTITETTIRQEFGVIDFFFNIKRGTAQLWVDGTSVCVPTSIHQLQNIISSLTGEHLKLKSE